MNMRISERGQVTIPKVLRDRFGMGHNVEVEMTATRKGILIHKRTAAEHPIERVYGCSATAAARTTIWRRSEEGDHGGRHERPA